LEAQHETHVHHRRKFVGPAGACRPGSGSFHDPEPAAGGSATGISNLPIPYRDANASPKAHTHDTIAHHPTEAFTSYDDRYLAALSNAENSDAIWNVNRSI